MHRSILQPSRTQNRNGGETADPTLFDGIGFEVHTPGEPWSEHNPPLTAVPHLKAVPAEVGFNEDHGRHNHEGDVEPDGDTIEAIEYQATDDSYDSGESCDDVELDELDEESAADDDCPVDEDCLAGDEEHVESPATPTGRPMPPLPSPGQIARLGIGTPGVVPRRIGRGRLVPARLTWKPGDPFAASAQEVKYSFRWELMLTAACVTAVCGLGCVWLLRTLLA
ncbi:MAG: hypothetical protein ABII12_09815 [Planctomycetota bacterium]